MHRFTIVLLVASGWLFGLTASAQSGKLELTPPPKPTRAATCDANAPDLTTALEVSGKVGPDAVKYVEAIRPRLRDSWYSLIGADLWMKKACTVISFTIRPDGGISSLRIDTSTGDLQLDRAAVAGILLAAPFASLPTDAPDPGLPLRIRLYYNPGDAKHSNTAQPARDARMTAPDDEPLSTDLTITSPSVIYSPNPERVPEVLENHDQQNDGKSVILEVTVSSKGDVIAARITSGLGNDFDEKALAAVFVSKFRPAMKDGASVRAEVMMRVRAR